MTPSSRTSSVLSAHTNPQFVRVAENALFLAMFSSVALMVYSFAAQVLSGHI